MVTSRDVAEHAGVSRATVSAVINKTRYVSPELTARVKQAIKELNYHPNAVARSLKIKRTQTIGLMIPTPLSPFYAPLVDAVEQALGNSNYRLLFCTSHESPDHEQRMLEMLRQKQVDGLLLVPCSNANASEVMDFVDLNIPVVFMDRRIPDLPVDTVVSDNRGGGYQATEHLIQLGRQRIAIVTFSAEASSSLERVEGYRQALSRHHLPIDDSLIVVSDDPSGEEAYYVALGLLDSYQPPDAIVACSQALTVAILRALEDKSVRIPQDIAVVGFDDSPWAPLLRPPLTVVTQQVYAMGQKAAELILDSLEGKSSGASREIILPTELIKRESCGWRIAQSPPLSEARLSLR